MALDFPRVSAEFRTIPRAGERHNGDAGFVRIGNVCWLAVIDGLGHGEGASIASAAAVDVLQEKANDTASVTAVVDAMDARLFGTRGAASLVCRLEGSRLTGCSIGNITLRCSTPGVGAVLSPGILGRRVRTLRVFEAQLPPRVRIMLFSDGVRRGAGLDEIAGKSVGEACEAILTAHRDHSDDATVLIADVVP